MARERSAHAWRHAFEERMAGCGYPRAFLDFTHMHGGISYTWGYDLDEWVDSHVENVHMPHNHEAWDTAHQVFIEVDHLRPLGIERSQALNELMNGRN
jgi:hypothetical protein